MFTGHDAVENVEEPVDLIKVVEDVRTHPQGGAADGDKALLLVQAVAEAGRHLSARKLQSDEVLDPVFLGRGGELAGRRMLGDAPGQRGDRRLDLLLPPGQQLLHADIGDGQVDELAPLAHVVAPGAGRVFVAERPLAGEFWLPARP